MADVKPTAGATRRDRAQLFLVTALALALVFVALALVLNSAIYTENLAARESDVAAAGDALTARENVRAGVGAAITHVNRNASVTDAYTARETAYDEAVAAWVRHAGWYATADAARLDVVPRDERRGTTIVDDDASTAYLPRDGTTTDWIVATDARVRAFRLAANASSLSSTPFVVALDTGSETWTVELAADGSNSTVEVDGPAGVDTCTTSSSTVVVDVSAGRVGGRPCRALDSLPLDEPLEVRFEDGDRASGTFALTVDRYEPTFRSAVNDAQSGDHCDPTYYDDAATGDPYTAQGVYAGTVDVAYETADVSYESTLRVAPGERGTPASQPVVERMAVQDATAGDGKFTVEWRGTDPDADLETVAVLLDGSVAYSESVSGASASSPAGGVEIAGADPSDNVIRVRVSDDAGNARIVTERHDDDGSPPGCSP